MKTLAKWFSGKNSHTRCYSLTINSSNNRESHLSELRGPSHTKMWSVVFEVMSLHHYPSLRRKEERREQKEQEAALTSANTAAGFPTSLRRETSVEAERKGPHLSCFCISGISLFSRPCSSGKSNLVNSNSGLDADPLFSMILDFLSVRL